jgi:ferrous iron transport protein B
LSSNKELSKVIIVGNPNAGKTSLFNALTGASQKVANFPGVTVEAVEGKLSIGDQVIRVFDIPGLYSLKPASEDERIASDTILGKTIGKPDLILYVADATSLARSLFLFSQLAESKSPTVIAMTMTDRYELQGKRLEIERLEQELGVPVIPISGRKITNLDAVKEAIATQLHERRTPTVAVELPAEMATAVSECQERIARIGVDMSEPEVRQNLFEPSEQFEQFLLDFPEIAAPFVAARKRLEELDLLKPSVDVSSRYRWSEALEARVSSSIAPAKRKVNTSERLDKWLTHPVYGLATFILIMYTVFQCIYSFSEPLMTGIELAFEWLAEGVRPYVTQNPIFESFVIDGLIAGVGGMIVFLPQILILFLLISVLEGTGYLARAAFLMDRLFGWCGLNGRAFIPFLSSYACAIPGIMAARVMPDSKSRLATIMVAPLMSCSARLPVYTLLIGTFIEPRFGAFWAGFTLFAMHMLGLVVAIPIVYLFHGRTMKRKRLPFVLELPAYQWPRWKDVWLTVVNRAKVFLKTAGTIIVVMSIVIWAAASFPRFAPTDPAQAAQSAGFTGEDPQIWVQEQQLERSYLGQMGKAVEPVFLPAGFDWRISTAILSAFPAREVIVASLGILFRLGPDADEESSDLRQAIARAKWPDGKPLFTAWNAIGLMVFFALCAQCMATLATVKRETNSWKWPIFMFMYMTSLAYLGAIVVHQIGKLVG